MNYAEIENIRDLEQGKVYACHWKDHQYESRVTDLSYIRVIKTSTATKSGEFVKTSGGNLCFSKLRWYGPFHATAEEINRNKQERQSGH